ncbi:MULTISPECIES: arylsulfatase [Protofrankia]|uniref:Arylsulfatase n=1 Tax=Candidatus Protofrankia datiscae TaxID=2716812 RepID=F8B0P0_9ACTN|nr:MULTISPECIES: arylsulfatase [Protofrankia]AEH10672.1 Arylsulfatase [Candidatus Protofrankia datiscae]
MPTSREPTGGPRPEPGTGPRPVPRPAPAGTRRDPYAGFGGRIGRTFGESEPAWPPRVRPDGHAPNIVVVLVDDMGYSDIGPFGAEIATPALDRLAEQGVRLTNYHTMPLCSPARAALLTGLNPHRVGYAMVANADPGFPGYGMEIADDIPTLAELLHDAGYATYAVGKWHLARDSASNAADDRRNWPLQKGFDQYYGVLEGLTSLFHPHQLVRDNSPLDIDDLPDGYYYTDDITDQAISMVASLRAHDADKPFFLYVAHNAVHGPLQAKPEDVRRYRGRYDGGWDALRETRFDRQRAAGLFPADTRLPRRNFEAGHEVGPWAELTPEQQRLYARYMEVYAAMVDNIDQNLGRLLDTLAALGELDNTIVIFTSDNGGTGEGGAEGTRSYFKRFVQHPNLPADWDPDVERDPELIGGPRSLVHYPRGWGMASNTPFRLYKGQTYAGGVRVPFILSWPAGLRTPAGDAGVRTPAGDTGIRAQYQYVTDITPTLLDLAGVARPARRRGRPVQELDGFSFVAVLADPDAPSTHHEQYCEMIGNRSYYRDGWKLVTLHRPGAPYDDGEWALYDVTRDPTEIVDLSAAHPDVVKELASAWEDAAWRNGVFPLADGSGALVIRNPAEERLRRPVTLLAGTPELERYRSAKLITFRSFDIVIELDEHAAGDEGVLVSHGDQGGGYSVYVEDGRLRFAYNEYGVLHEADAGPLPAGRHTVRVRAQAIPGLRWDWRILVDGTETGRLADVHQLIGMAPLQGISVGVDRKSPVSWPVHERHRSFRYTGRLKSVTYIPGPPAPDDPETLVRTLREAAATFE